MNVPSTSNVPDGEAFAQWRPTCAPWRNAGKTKKLARTGEIASYKYGTIVEANKRRGEQGALICSWEAKTAALDVDDPFTYEAEAGLPFSREHATTTRGEFRYHVILDYRDIPEELYPRQGKIPGGDIKANGFVPIPGCMHYSGDRYEATGRAPIRVTIEQARQIKELRERTRQGGGGRGGGGSDGQHDQLRDLAWKLRAQSTPEAEAYRQLRELAGSFPQDPEWPWTDDDLKELWESADDKQSATAATLPVELLSYTGLRINALQDDQETAAATATGISVKTQASKPPRPFLALDKVFAKFKAEANGHPLSRDWEKAPPTCRAMYESIGLRFRNSRMVHQKEISPENHAFLTEHELIWTDESGWVHLLDDPPAEKRGYKQYPGWAGGEMGAPNSTERLDAFTLAYVTNHKGERHTHARRCYILNQNLVAFGLTRPVSVESMRQSVKRLKDAGRIHVALKTEPYRRGNMWRYLPPAFAPGPDPDPQPPRLRLRPFRVARELYEWAASVAAGGR